MVNFPGKPLGCRKLQAVLLTAATSDHINCWLVQTKKPANFSKMHAGSVWLESNVFGYKLFQLLDISISTFQLNDSQDCNRNYHRTSWIMEFHCNRIFFLFWKIQIQMFYFLRKDSEKLKPAKPNSFYFSGPPSN